MFGPYKQQYFSNRPQTHAEDNQGARPHRPVELFWRLCRRCCTRRAALAFCAGMLRWRAGSFAWSN